MGLLFVDLQNVQSITVGGQRKRHICSPTCTNLLLELCVYRIVGHRLVVRWSPDVQVCADVVGYLF